MKSFPALVAGLLILCASGAFAESRVFISANPPDRNGLDRCLANSETCGAQAAKVYCQSHDFAKVITYRRVDPDEVTGSVPKPAAESCPNGGCNEYIAIICQR
jgi:hypothetical protein